MTPAADTLTAQVLATPEWVMRRRGGLPSMTGRMFALLRLLRAAKRTECPYVSLSFINARTLYALQDRDWAVADGARYSITARGLKALKVYEQPARHFDGMCPACEQQPKGTYSTGNQKAYCDDCCRLHGRKQFALKGYQLRADTLCSRCHKQPRHEYPSGKRITYCAHCRKVLRRAEKRRQLKRKLWLIGIGRPPICLKCDQPVYHTPHAVYDYCYQHYRAQQNAWLQKRAAQL